MNKLIIIGLFLGIAMPYFSQNEEDALRYSNLDLQGSARYASMGGAFGALGTDVSVLAVNPAGMARVKSNILSGTFNLGLSNVKSNFNGVTTSSPWETLDLNNIGIIGVVENLEGNPWRKVQFGFAYNRMAEFNRKSIIKGNSDASFSYILADRGYGFDPNQLVDADPFYSSLAYESYLTDFVYDSSEMYYTTQMYGNEIPHEHTINSSGRVGESDFSVSGNYQDKFYIGATIGRSVIKFKQVKTYYEESTIDSLELANFSFKEKLTTQGRGFNLKVGAIFLPQPWIRLGLAVHSATKYHYMRDDWSTEIATNFKNGDAYDNKMEGSNFVYKLRTPGRIIGSVALVAKKYGVISVDVEYVDYGKARLNKAKKSKDSYDFNFENETASKLYQSALNIRIGGEYKITNQFMGRLGYAINGNPFRSEFKEGSTAKQKFSGGLGFRTENFFVDFAVIYATEKGNYYMYDPQLVNNTIQIKSLVSSLLTVGIKI